MWEKPGNVTGEKKRKSFVWEEGYLGEAGGKEKGAAESC